MATSLTILQARMTDELPLLGTMTSAIQQNIIRDALMRFLRKVDKPIISANMAVVADDDGPYSVPSTIDKVSRIYDNSTAPALVNFTIDLTKREITLQEDPATSGNYDVRGTPKDVRTNIVAIIEALREDYEDVLWEYIRAFAMRQAGAMEAYKLELQAADKALAELRKSINRNLDQERMPVQFLDTTGRVVADIGNAEGLDVDINDHLESDL